MTHREAMTISLSELGFSKREIWKRLEFADRESGWSGNKALNLNPGETERDRIEAIKTGYWKFMAMPKEERWQVFRDLDNWHRERLEGN